jgi:hypothetical protein
MGYVYRFSAPSWVGVTAIPVNGQALQSLTNGQFYRWINVGPDGAELDSAPMDGPKDGGPNSGTSMVAFGEDFTSEFANRGFRALSQTTDAFDEWLNADHPLAFLHQVTLTVPSNTVTIPSLTYLGPSGTTLNSTNLPKYFRILDESLDEVVFDDNEVVVAQSCTVATSPTPPYTSGSETLTLNRTILAGTYYILCSRRRSIATAERDALLSPVIAGVARIPGSLRAVVRTLRGDGEDIFEPWQTTINDLLLRCFDGVYRNASTLPTPPSAITMTGYGTSADLAGFGGWFRRDGAAALGYSALELETASNYQDPFGAIWAAWAEDHTPADGEGPGEFMTATRGFAYVGQRVLAQNATASLTRPPSYGGFGAFVAHYDTHQTTTLVPTYINPAGCNVNLQRISGSDRVTITSGGNYFRKTLSGTPRSSIILGVTLLEIRWTNPSDPLFPGVERKRVYRVMEILSDTSVRVRNPDGSQPSFPAGATAGVISRWITPTFQVLDGLQEMQAFKAHPDAALFESGSFWAISPPIHTQTTADQIAPGQGAYLGASENTSSALALRWGGYSRTTFQLQALGQLRGDGSVACTNIAASGSVSCASLSVVGAIQCGNVVCDDIFAQDIECDTVTTVTVTADAVNADNVFTNLLARLVTSVTDSTNSNHALNLTTALQTSGHVFVTISGSASNITSITLPSMSTGTRFAISFYESTAGTIAIGAWPVAVKFQNPADALLTGVAGYTTTYEGTKMPDGTIQMTVARTT